MKIKTKAVSAILLAAATAYMLCIFEPLNIFFKNKNEYVFDFYQMIPTCLCMFLIFFLAEFVVLILLYKTLTKAYPVFIGCAFTGMLCLYVQGNFFAGRLPLLDGNYIDWSKVYNLYVQSAIICAVVFATVFVLLSRLKDRFFRIEIIICSFLLGIFLLTNIISGVMYGGFEKKHDYAATSSDVLKYSKDTNYIILVMDTMSGVVETDVLNENPEFKDVLKDFTFYDNYTSGYDRTWFALPLLFGGEWYVKQEELETFKEKAFLNSPLISELRERDYKIGIYTDDVKLTDSSWLSFYNVEDKNIRLARPVAFAKVWLRMVGYKYLPYFLKRYSQVLPGEFNQCFERQGSRRWDFYDSNMPFYRESVEMNYDFDYDKIFKFIHLYGAHWYPEAFNEDMELVPTSDYEDSVRSVNIIIQTYLERLKKEGVYDNSVILIMGDHGANIDESEFDEQEAILFIKGINETHDELNINSAPIAQEDLINIYEKLMDGADGTDIFDYKEGDYRERRFFTAKTVDDDFVEYVQTGLASDITTVRETGKVYR